MLNGNLHKMTIKEIFLSLLAITIVLLVPHSGIIPLPFGYAIPILIFIWLFLKSGKETFDGIGFSFKRFEIKAAILGSIAGIALFSFLNWVFFPLLQKIIDLPPANLDDFAKIRGNTGFYIFLIAMSWSIGGFYEEIVFHGFIFTRLEKMLPGKHAILLSFVFTNVVFGLYHLQLGIAGAINALLAGFAYHATMLFNKRNMWYAVFCHAMFDTIALTFMYFGY